MTLDLSAPDLASQLRALDFDALSRLAVAMPRLAGRWASPSRAGRPRSARRSLGGSRVARVQLLAVGWIATVGGEHLVDDEGDLLIFGADSDAQRAADAELVKRGYVLEDPMP